jgi:tRNA pseudouridine38-40 synthase
MSRRVALLLEYDGSRFAGSQLQTNSVTVQSVLEQAVLKTTGEQLRVAFAGRTDAGVHALAQVASFTTHSRLDTETMRRALNAWLPEDVAVLEITEVRGDFDPRRQAVARHYRYVIENRPSRPAIDRLRAWHLAQPLDIDAMAEAARRVVGTRNFAAFASRLEEETASTVRRLTCFKVQRSGTRIICDARANAFLPHQIRRMVGALVEVGKGRLTPEGYEALLAGAPASAGPAAPAYGLYLVRVDYNEELFPAQRLDSESSL